MLNKQDLQYKDFIRSEIRLKQVRDELYAIPLTKLQKPYQAGWIIKYDLRDDVKRRKDSDAIYQAMEIGYHLGWVTNDVNVVRAIRRGEKSRKAKKGAHVDFRPKGNHIYYDTYIDLPIEVQSHFQLDRFYQAYVKYGRKYYVSIIPDHWLVLKAKPNIIKYIRKKGGELESEKAYLEKKLDEFWRKSYGYRKVNTQSARRIIRDDLFKFKKGDTDDVFNKKVKYDYH